MRFLKVLLPVIVFATVVLVPHAALAAETSFFGPIYPEQCVCPGSAPEFGCVLETIRNLINFVLSMGVVIFILILSYAGFLFMTSSVNAENRNKAKSILMNAVIGLIIALAAWLIVDFVMKVFYNGRFGPWNTILVGEGEASHCIDPITPTITGTPTPPGTGSGGISGTPGAPGTPTTPEGPSQPGATTPAQPGDLSGITLNIGANAVVSTSAQTKLKQILRNANLTSASITSGRRTAADQARIMEENLHNGNRIDYAAPGEAVTEVYDRMKDQGASRADIRAAMEAEINRQGCYNVSKHCTPGDVIDVSPGSIANRTAFEAAVRAFGVTRFLRPGEFSETTYHIEF